MLSHLGRPGLPVTLRGFSRCFVPSGPNEIRKRTPATRGRYGRTPAEVQPRDARGVRAHPTKIQARPPRDENEGAAGAVTIPGIPTSLLLRRDDPGSESA